MIPLIYIAGAYRGKTRYRVDLNIHAARHVGVLMAAKGWYPVIPHANTYHFDDLIELPQEFWLEGTLELMRKCDAVIFVPGWENSDGSQGEYKEAERLGKAIYYETREVPKAQDFVGAL